MVNTPTTNIIAEGETIRYEHVTLSVIARAPSLYFLPLIALAHTSALYRRVALTLDIGSLLLRSSWIAFVSHEPAERHINGTRLFADGTILKCFRRTRS